MNVIVDTREQRPWTFAGQKGIETVRAKLETGDYSIEGLESRVTIERKSLADWIKTVIKDRNRFYRELERMRGFDLRWVIIEAGVREIMEAEYRSRTDPASVLGFVYDVMAGQRVPVLLAGSRAEAQVMAGGLLKSAAKRLAAAPLAD